LSSSGGTVASSKIMTWRQSTTASPPPIHTSRRRIPTILPPSTHPGIQSRSVRTARIFIQYVTICLFSRWRVARGLVLVELARTSLYVLFIPLHSLGRISQTSSSATFGYYTVLYSKCVCGCTVAIILWSKWIRNDQLASQQSVRLAAIHVARMAATAGCVTQMGAYA
jgi:hypothetical protein